MHLDEKVLGADGQIDPDKIDLVARMGKDYYCRASGAAVFEVPKPNLNLGIGFDALPKAILESSVLTGNDLGLLANSARIPELQMEEELEARIKQIKVDYGTDKQLLLRQLHEYAKTFLLQQQVDKAWQVLLAGLG
jgi:hypothetical protein